MTMMNGRLDYHELSLRELGTHDWETITAQFRRDRPVCLITPLQHLAGHVVMNVFAPKGAALWCFGLHRIGSACRSSVEVMFGDPVAKAALMRDLRLAKIRMASPQIRLLDQYVDAVGASRRSVESLSVARSYAETWRHVSIGASAANVPAVLARLEREAEAFGDRAFFGIDESVVLADPSGASSIGAQLFHGTPYEWGRTPAEREKRDRDILKGLKREISRFGDGLPFDTPIEPIWMIKGGVSIWFPNWGEPAEDGADEVYLEMLLHRARLVRLLGWPHHYHSVLLAIRNIEDPALTRAGASAGAPYDGIFAELRAYIGEMRQRYPVFDEPFSLG